MSEPRLPASLDDLRDLLRSVKTIAVVGISPDPSRESHGIAGYLKTQGFRIVGVNPAATEVVGVATYPSLTEIPEPTRREVDLVLVFRRPEAVPAILEEAARLGLARVWLQLGVSSGAAINTAKRLGLTLVAEKCIRVVHGLIARSRPGGA